MLMIILLDIYKIEKSKMMLLISFILIINYPILLQNQVVAIKKKIRLVNVGKPKTDNDVATHKIVKDFFANYDIKLIKILYVV